jgi:glyoxylase-like metal-dependent hydrolase (beta-lactamase superfamily II)
VILVDAGIGPEVAPARRWAPVPGRLPHRLVPTPGHTPGHQSVLLDRGDGTLPITGDLLVHAVQLVDPELAYAYETDPEAARASRMRLLRELAARASEDGPVASTSGRSKAPSRQ